MAQKPLHRAGAGTESWALEARAWRAQLGAYGVVLTNLLVLFCFVFPFSAVSCGSAKTEPMTGFQLIRGDEPTYTYAPGGSEDVASDRRDIEKALEEVVTVSRLEFGAAALGVLFGLLAAVLTWYAENGALSEGNDRGVSFLLPGSFLVPFSFAAGITAGSEVFGPDVHHFYGFWLAAGLSLLGVVPAYVHARAVMAGREPTERAARLCLIAVVAIVFCGLVGLAVPFVLVLAALACAFGLVVGIYTLIAYRPSIVAMLATLLGGMPMALFGALLL